ncbi:hypothetical protein [Pseudoalteromonas sp. BDTF-M6]|uniref:hypothetical protein n=1 Tax=Pseudoalteromonas sp. BDTF-M6 TaxID=2796132 RepID=UPI001BAEC4F7|nr:hypothetical protein [Pseudoalteromonas sp. BDTF-M6]MBS3796160.1 hypothetical protein [Pseudoalteromonas sp. BDTF-M6]
MFRLVSQVLVIAAVLFALLGQAFAYSAMTCETTMDAHQSHVAMKMAPEHTQMQHHQGMAHGDTAMSAAMMDDCCEVQCVCPASACASVTVVNSSTAMADVIAVSEAVISATPTQPSAIQTSLFRPPIFA